jgi:pimeloyl-ACP methyl ester carboxylesterase
MQKARGLEYAVMGKGGGSPVLTIHGALIADTFLPVCREASLADRYRLIRYRRRGHGGSDPYSGAISLDTPAQDAVALLDHLGVERAHVIGHSGGGLMAVALALAAPERVHSLVLLEPAIFSPDVTSAFVQGAAPVLEAFGSGDAARALDLWMELVSVGADWRSEIESSVPGAVKQAENDCAAFFEFEIPAIPTWAFGTEQAKHVSQPVLYAVGSESGPLYEAAAKYFRTLVPQTEYIDLPGVDHSMLTSDPKLVAETAAEFLARHPL